MSTSIHVTHDEEHGLSYIALKPIRRGEARKQRHALGDDDIILDFDRQGYLIGIELLRTSLLHPALRPQKNGDVIDELMEQAIRKKDFAYIKQRLKDDVRRRLILNHTSERLRILRAQTRAIKSRSIADFKTGFGIFEEKVRHLEAIRLVDDIYSLAGC